MACRLFLEFYLVDIFVAVVISAGGIKFWAIVVFATKFRVCAVDDAGAVELWVVVVVVVLDGATVFWVLMRAGVKSAVDCGTVTIVDLKRFFLIKWQNKHTITLTKKYLQNWVSFVKELGYLSRSSNEHLLRAEKKLSNFDWQVLT